MIGCAAIRHSDVLFSIPPEIRKAIESEIENGDRSAVGERLKKRGLSIDWEDVYTVLRHYGHALGDMYEDIRTIEVGLHRLIRQGLEQKFGASESGWWRKGVPLKVRMKCVDRREEDDSNDWLEPYCYTDLIDLSAILESNWSVLCDSLPKQLRNQKRPLLKDLSRLNEIRRNVMHPVRGGVPNEEAFKFSWDLRQTLGFLE